MCAMWRSHNFPMIVVKRGSWCPSSSARWKPSTSRLLELAFRWSRSPTHEPLAKAESNQPGEGNGQPPKVSCLYHSEDGENAFLSKETLKEKIGVGGATSGGGGRSANNE